MNKNVFLFVILVSILLLSSCSGETTTTIKSGEVVGLQYVPATSGSGVSIGISPDGGIIPIFGVDSGESEKFLVFIKVGDNLDKHRVDAELYFTLSVGDSVKIIKTCNFGCNIDIEKEK